MWNQYQKKDYLALKDKKDFRKIVRKDFDKYNRFLKKSGLSFDLIKIKHASNLCLNFDFKTETNNSSDEETNFACAKACDMANLSRRNYSNFRVGIKPFASISGSERVNQFFQIINKYFKPKNQ